jgi:hypothetical protein
MIVIPYSIGVLYLLYRYRESITGIASYCVPAKVPMASKTEDAGKVEISASNKV